MDILLIQILRLGDALQMIPIIRGLKHFFPDSRIRVLTSTVGEKIFSREPHVEEVFVLHNKEIADLVNRQNRGDTLSGLELLQSDLKPLITRSWDWVINFSFSYPSALITFLLDAEHRSGYTVNKHRQYLSKEKWFGYSLASFSNRRYSNFNWVDINKKIIGLPAVPANPLIQPGREALQKASRHLEEIGFKGKRIIGMHPGASGDYKRWPLSNFTLLGQNLAEQYDYRILLFGADNEMDLGRVLKDHLGPGAEDLTGRTSLPELEAYLSLCDLLVTNDTGPMHLAASVGTKVVALFFNSYFVETGPYGKGHVAVHPDMDCFPCKGPAKCPHKDCLERISPETIEKIVLNEKEDQHLKDILERDGEGPHVHISDFDPWGMLQWISVNKNAMTFKAVEKMLLKISWLSRADIIDPFDDVEEKYVLDFLGRHDIRTNEAAIAESLERFTKKAGTFRDFLSAAENHVLELQSELTKEIPDPDAVRLLGDRLSETEHKIRTFDTDSSISFLSELTTVMLESIEQSGLVELSEKTLGVYHDMIAFADILIKRLEKFRTLLHPLDERKQVTA